MKSIATFALVVGLFFLTFSILSELYKIHHQSTLISPVLGVQKAINTMVNADELSNPQEDQKLYELLKENIEKGEFGIYLLKPSTHEIHTYNKDMIFPAASLYKLVVLAAAYQQIEDGLMQEETVMSMPKSSLAAIYGDVDYGYEDAPATIEMTVSDAFSRIARYSDNFAAILLSQTIRRNAQNAPKKERVKPWWEALFGIDEKREVDEDPIVATAKDLGLKNTTFDPPQTTPADMGRFFELLYKGEIVSQESSDKFINLLATSQINNRIPAKLSENPSLKIAHKTGELSAVRHDAGIVFPHNSDKSKVERSSDDYVVVLLSKDLVFEDTGIDNLAEMSRKIYDLMVSQK
jgi:beta-lactamase class A